MQLIKHENTKEMLLDNTEREHRQTPCTRTLYIRIYELEKVSNNANKSLSNFRQAMTLISQCGDYNEM